MKFTLKSLCGIATALLLTAGIAHQATARENFNEEYFRRYLKQNSFSIDPSAPAVVLYEKGTVEIVPENGWLVSQKVHRIVKILKKEGLSY